MKITKAFLEKHKACEEGKQFFLSEDILDHEAGILNLLEKGKVAWANWLIVRLMTHKQKVMYTVFAAKQVLSIFEKQYPTDKRPRQAIEAALKFAANPSKNNKQAAYAAAYAAKVVANAAYAAANAANAAYAAANEATYAANAAKKKKQLKILKYGLKLLAE